MWVVDFGSQFDTEIEWIIRFRFCVLVFAEIEDVAFMTTNMDRQLDQIVNICLYRVQFSISTTWSSWRCILVINFIPKLSGSYVLVFAFGLC